MAAIKSKKETSSSRYFIARKANNRQLKAQNPAPINKIIDGNIILLLKVCGIITGDNTTNF
jgi:hypothetical protein